MNAKLRDDHLTEPDLKPPIILVVEDEVLIRMAVADHLRDCGFSVVEAGNAAEAVTVLEAAVPVDVVFTDVNMPGEMNGFGLAQWVRANKPGLKVIITSGAKHKAEEIRDLCEEGPLLIKPYNHAEAERRIREILGKSAVPPKRES